MRLSAGLTIVGLAMALLGPAPAVAIALVSRILDAVLADGIRVRGRRLALVWNLGMIVYVLLGGLVIRLVREGGVDRGSAVFALVVVATISAANLLNFVLAATWIRAHTGIAIIAQLRRDYLPALSWIAAPNFVAGALVIVYVSAGPATLVLSLGAARSLLRAAGRAAQLPAAPRPARAAHGGAGLPAGGGVRHHGPHPLAARQVTARHSAAVARYAQAIATAAGCSAD